jgi:DNA-binding MarR family transcriptional regulator
MLHRSGRLNSMNAAARPDAPPSRAGQGSPCGGALRDDLGWGLGVLFRSYAKAATAAFAELPGGPRGYQVLATASRGEPGSQLKLAHHLGVDRTVMTYLLDDLEGAGLIERRPDPADRRARRILVTALGHEPNSTCWPAWPPTRTARRSAHCCSNWRRTPTPWTPSRATARSRRRSPDRRRGLTGSSPLAKHRAVKASALGAALVGAALVGIARLGIARLRAAAVNVRPRLGRASN